MLIILDPEHVKGVLNSSKAMDPNPFIHGNILGNLMGTPKETIDYYNSEDSNTDYIQTTHIRQHTTGSNLTSLDKRLFETLKRSIDQELASKANGEWIDIPDLYAFVEYHVTSAITATLLGSAIVESYPEIIPDLCIHIDATDALVMGLPRFMIPKAYAARDRILSTFQKWSAKAETLRIQKVTNTEWDPIAGSGLLQERETLYSELPGHDGYARATQTLGLLYAGTSLTVPLTFWYFYEIMRDTSLLSRVAAELKNTANPTTGSYNLMSLAARPLLQSTHAETTRLYSSNLTVRQVVTPVYVLDDKYTIEKGTNVFIFNKYVNTFERGWKESRPQALARPLDTFWAERYFIGGGGDEKRERFSDAGLSGNWTSFGGGEHKCPGRHFARNIGIVTLAVLMGVFEVEIVDVEGSRKFDPELKAKAFGGMKPKGKVAARIRRRDD
jgi:hypothetical protein